MKIEQGKYYMTIYGDIYFISSKDCKFNYLWRGHMLDYNNKGDLTYDLSCCSYFHEDGRGNGEPLPSKFTSEVDPPSSLVHPLTNLIFGR